MDWKLFSKKAKGDDVGAIEGSNLFKSLCLIFLSFTLLLSHIIMLSISYIYSSNCHFLNYIYCEFYLGKFGVNPIHPLLDCLSTLELTFCNLELPFTSHFTKLTLAMASVFFKQQNPFAVTECVTNKA